MQRIVAILAFLSSLTALVVLSGGGLTLLAIENSGERGTGALLAICGAVAFASVVFLVFAGSGWFVAPTRRAVAVAAAVVGAMPVAGLSVAALRFAGLPLQSAMPQLDWTIFAAGTALAAGGLSILALGYFRAREGGNPAPEVIQMEQIREAQQQLRSAFENSQSAPVVYDDDGDVRVRRV